MKNTVTDICKKHRLKPAIIYGKCVGCELDGLRKKVSDMEGKLKVIHTWASFDISVGQQVALVPEHVLSLCDKARKRTFREKYLESCKGTDNQIYNGECVPFTCKGTGKICSSKNCPLE